MWQKKKTKHPKKQKKKKIGEGEWRGQAFGACREERFVSDGQPWRENPALGGPRQEIRSPAAALPPSRELLPEGTRGAYHPSITPPSRLGVSCLSVLLICCSCAASLRVLRSRVVKPAYLLAGFALLGRGNRQYIVTLLSPCRFFILLAALPSEARRESAIEALAWAHSWQQAPSSEEDRPLV